MCGIAGIIQRDGKSPDPAILKRMANTLHHRGPDGSGQHISENVGLAHTRLALLGLGDSGAQPMLHPSGDWAITYNGEIFNHLELRPAEIRYQGNSDTETLLAALAREPLPNILPKLNGFFAFAAVDRRSRKLHLVRDSFGVKPIFYASDAERFYFASEAKAILAAGFSTSPDPEILRQHLARQWNQGAQTPFTGIRKVLPGERLEIDLGTSEIKHIQWHKLTDWTDPGYAAELASLPYNELVELVAHHTRRATQGRLLADVPVATFCSGGVDSSYITAIAAAERNDLHAFVIQPLDDPASDESDYAQQACDHTGVKLHRVQFDAAKWRDTFLKTIPNLENPLWIEASTGRAILAEAITSAGYKAALGGEAADELFGGYDYRYPEERAAFAAEIGRQPLEVKNDFEALPVDPDMTRALRHPNTNPESTEHYLQTALTEARQAFAHHSGARQELEARALAEMRIHLAATLDQADKSTMSHSLEYREPFLDKDLVRLAINLPLESKTFPEIKSVLREASRPHIPADILTRRKIGFSFHTDHFLEGKIRPSFYEKTMLEELLGIKNKKVAKWFQPDRGRATSRICSAEIWLRHFIKGETIGEIGEALWAD